jgi:50S ribosomal protein L16 3-hydroxylase
MISPLGELETEVFLSQFWQKKACLLKQAFPAFDPPLDGNDLAGLACEEMGDARIVSGRFPEHDWKVQYGPFDESVFSELPDTDWTLLVQDVEKHYPPLQSLIQRFQFLPSWRMDDLMVSYAVTGGSVGPHVDQYDVFLLQAGGRRRWQIASDFDEAEQTDCDLSVLQTFEPEHEWILEPGDMLYLPPGIAHHGVALEPGMTWSFGFRAPSAADLLQGFGEWLSFRTDQGGRYRDPEKAQSPLQGEIDADALKSLRRLLQDCLDNEADLHHYLGSFISRFRLAQQPAPPPVPIDSNTVLESLVAGTQPARHPWTRMNWIRHGKLARLYAAGDVFICSPATAKWLCSLPSPNPEEHLLDNELVDLLTALVNAGHLLMTGPEIERFT